MRNTAERSILGRHSLQLVAPAVVNEFLGWALGRGTSMTSSEVGGKNQEKYNRLHLHIWVC